MNNLDACIYCPGEPPRNRKLAKRLRDTRQNRLREDAIFKSLTQKETFSVIRYYQRKTRTK